MILYLIVMYLFGIGITIPVYKETPSLNGEGIKIVTFIILWFLSPLLVPIAVGYKFIQL